MWLPERWRLTAVRRSLLRQARGRVIELGVGTGLNLSLYPKGAVQGVWAVEPDPWMLARARGRARRSPVPVELVQAEGEALPFPAASFDTAVVTLVLCSVADPWRAVHELFRVLRPGGTLLVFEHVRSRSPAYRRLQEAVAPAWRRVAAGCRLDQDPEPLIAARFEVVARTYRDGPLPLLTLVARRGR